MLVVRRLLFAVLFAVAAVVGAEAAPTDAVTQADLRSVIERLERLEAENRAQARRIAELEDRNRALVARLGAEASVAAPVGAAPAVAAKDDAREAPAVREDAARVVTDGSGRRHYLAEACSGVFEPLTKAGLRFTPYGYLVLQGMWADHGLDRDWSTDFVHRKSSRPYGNHDSTLTMQDSILGLELETPESFWGWKFAGRLEFDFAGENADEYAFHWRHIYIDARHDAYGFDGAVNGSWSVLAGQTWHLWRMVSPSEIDDAFMENTGHPYRRSQQIRVTRKWDWSDSSLEARVGFVKNGPGSSADRDHDGMLDSSASSWGWFEGALLYDHKADWQDGDDRWLVGLAGMYGQTCAHRASAWGDDGLPVAWDGDDDGYESKMLMLAASIPFGDFTLTGQMFFGNNLGRIQAGCGQDVVYQPYQEKGTGVGTYGGFVDLRYRLNDSWSFVAGYGFDDPVDSDVSGTGGVLFNDRAYLDAFYRVTDFLRFGLEYARLTTRYDGDGTSAANRVQFSAYYDF